MKTPCRGRSHKAVHRGLIALAVVGIGFAVFLLLDSMRKVGEGDFALEVVLDSVKPIARVSYCSSTLDGATRQEAEAEADPRLFLWRETVEPQENRFTARVRFTSAVGFFSTSMPHSEHLIVLAEFTDGSRACRVVNVPERSDKEPVVVSFR